MPQARKFTKRDTDKFAKAIRQTRRRLVMTQIEFADMLGISQQKLSELECGLHVKPILFALHLADVMRKAGNAR